MKIAFILPLYSHDLGTVMAGYVGEHEGLLQHGWMFEQWETSGGYSNTGGSKNENSKKEALWYSPYCLKHGKQKSLFG